MKLGQTFIIIIILFLIIFTYNNEKSKIKMKLKEHKTKQKERIKENKEKKKEKKQKMVIMPKIKIIKLTQKKNKKIAYMKKEKYTKLNSPLNNKNKTIKNNIRKNKGLNSNSSNSKGGENIVIIGKYNLPIKEYLKYMKNIGAKLVVYDSLKKNLVCEIKNEKLYDIEKLYNFSSRARIITSDYPNSTKILKKVINKFGKGDYQILLILPKDKDEEFYYKLKREIISQGIVFKNVLSVVIRYFKSYKRIRVNIITVNTQNKSYKTNLNFIF